jgi:hypothetical protein
LVVFGAFLAPFWHPKSSLSAPESAKHLQRFYYIYGPLSKPCLRAEAVQGFLFLGILFHLSLCFYSKIKLGGILAASRAQALMHESNEK